MSVENFTAEFLYQVNTANLMLLSGRPSRPVDAVFFHDRAYGDFTGLFEMATALQKTGAARFIATPNTDGAKVGSNIPGEVSPGKVWVQRQLLERGVPLRFIKCPDLPSHHTWEENNAFLQLAMKMEWRSAIILTQPHQLLRAMLGMLKAMDNTGYLMEVYTAAPTNTPWHEITRGSQGLEAKPRAEHIDDEVDRIPRYQQKGDLVALDELFAYLAARNRSSLRFTNNFQPGFS